MFAAIRSRTHYILAGILIPILALATTGSIASSTKSCTGTYLVNIAQSSSPASQGIWTFSDDGTFQSTDSAEDAATPFSHGQGAWRATRNGTKVSYLDYHLDGAALPTLTARFDMTLTFANYCKTVTGSGTLYFFSYPTGNPLDITTAAFSLTGFTFSGSQLFPTP